MASRSAFLHKVAAIEVDKVAGPHSRNQRSVAHGPSVHFLIHELTQMPGVEELRGTKSFSPLVNILRESTLQNIDVMWNNEKQSFLGFTLGRSTCSSLAI